MPIKPDSKDADFGAFSAILRHRPPVLAHSTDALIILIHPPMACGVLPRFHVVAFQKVCTGEGAVDCRDTWVWSWIPTASGGVFCGIARADAGLRSPHRRRFSTTSSRPFTGSAPERDNDRRLSNVPEFLENCRLEFRSFTGS